MSEETEEGSKMGRGGVAGGMRRKKEAKVASEHKQ